MSRLAVIVGDAIGSDAPPEQTLQRFGYSRLQRTAALADAMEVVSDEHVDLLVVPVEGVSEQDLAALDRVLRRERHMGVIATSPQQDPQLMLRSMRAGIQEFLVRPIALPDLVAALERLHRRVDAREVNGQVFAVFSAKGGVGTTTTAVNLASALAANHGEAKIAVADMALPGGDVALLLNVRPAYDLSELSSKIERLDSELLNSVMTPAADGVWFLAAPERADSADSVDAGAVSAILAQMRSAYAFTVVDCEHQLTDRTLAALDGADRILLLTELKVPALRAAQRTLGIFRRLGYPNEKLCVIVNRLQSGDVVSPAEASQVLKADIFFKLPNDYRTVSEAATRGQPVVQSHPDSRLAWAYLQLAHKLGGGSIVASGEAGNGSRSVLRQIFTRKRN
ncbi:MAG: P-loop NTPase [Gemmatimonadaceae bacterium]|nr:P-loop NTPase [Gemmatimonadaceae bacterium]